MKDRNSQKQDLPRQGVEIRERSLVNRVMKGSRSHPNQAGRHLGLEIPQAEVSKEVSQTEKVKDKIYERQVKILSKIHSKLKGVKPFNKEQVDPLEVAYYLGREGR